MLVRFAVLALAFTLGLGVVTTGCAGPYTGTPERLDRPKKKKRPKPKEGETASAPALDDKCRTNFYAEPTTRRRADQGRSLSRQADRLLYEAEEQEGTQRVTAIGEALDKLRNALKADPYGPEPTYRMAVAYAMVGKKGCSLALLQRLQELTKLPDVESEAERTINRALNDQSFAPFRKEADSALGR